MVFLLTVINFLYSNHSPFIKRQQMFGKQCEQPVHPIGSITWPHQQHVARQPGRLGACIQADESYILKMR